MDGRILAWKCEAERASRSAAAKKRSSDALSGHCRALAERAGRRRIASASESLENTNFITALYRRDSRFARCRGSPAFLCARQNPCAIVVGTQRIRRVRELLLVRAKSHVRTKPVQNQSQRGETMTRRLVSGAVVGVARRGIRRRRRCATDDSRPKGYVPGTARLQSDELRLRRSTVWDARPTTS